MISFIAAFQYLRRFTPILGFRTYWAIIFSFLGSLLESFGLLALTPILLTIDNREGGFETASWMPEKFVEILSRMDTVVVLLLFIGMFAARAVLQFISLAIISTLKGHLLRKLKIDLLEAYSNVDFLKFSQGSIGGFNNAIGEQATKSIQAFNFLVMMVSSLLSAIVFLIVGLLANFSVGILLVGTSLLVFLIFGRINTFARDLSRRTVKQHSNLADAVVHLFSGFRYLRATGLIDIEKTKSNDAITKLSRLQILQGYAQALTASVREPLVVLIVVFVIFLHVTVNGGSVSYILVSLVLFYRGFNAFHAVQVNAQRSFDFVASFEFVEKELREYGSRRTISGSLPLKPFSRLVEFKKVSFAYDQSVLQNLNIQLRKGKTIALAGPSGSGKTTIANLLTGNLIPSSGTIQIDGVNMNDIDLADWQSEIGYVDQESWMPAGTIFENIVYGAKIEGRFEETEAKVRELIQKVGLEGWVNSLEENLMSEVGDFGNKLSGGQRQRLAIARELFRSPKILIFDEATSALDSVSENLVVEVLEKLKGTVTVLIIAHRVSTLKCADEIYWMSNGSARKVVDVETFLRENIEAKLSE